MNSKTLKVTGAVVLSCLAMILIVIYTPKPTPTPNQSREMLEERLQRFKKEFDYIDLVMDALRKINEAAAKANEVTAPFGKQLLFNDKEEPYLKTEQLNPLIERITKAISGLNEASMGIKQRNKRLQSFHEKNVELKSSIDASIKANTKLIGALKEVSEAMQTLTELLQRFTKENAHLHLSPAHAVYDVFVTTSKATDGVVNASEAYFEYQRAQIRNSQW